MALPHGAVGWSTKCDIFGISLLYSLAILVFIAYALGYSLSRHAQLSSGARCISLVLKLTLLP